MPGPAKQVVSLPFTAGVDSKTDALLALKPSHVENRVVRGGSLQRRYGTQAMTAGYASGASSYTHGEALAAAGLELVRLNDGALLGYSPAGNTWVAKATGAYSMQLSVTPVLRNPVPVAQTPDSVRRPDSVLCNGYFVTAYMAASTGRASICVEDAVTGNKLYNATPSGFSVTGKVPRCVACGEVVLVFALSTTGPNLLMAVVDTRNPAAAPTVSTVATDVATGGGGQGGMDACSYDANTALVAYYSGASRTTVTLLRCDAAGAMASPPSTVVLTSSSGTVSDVKCLRASTGNIFAAFTNEDAGGGTAQLAYAVVGASFAPAVLSQTTVSTGYRFRGWGWCETTAGNVALVWEEYHVSTSLSAIRYALVNASGVSTAATSFLAAGGDVLASGPVYDATNLPVAAAWVYTANRSAGLATETTACLVTVAGAVLARCLIGEASVVLPSFSAAYGVARPLTTPTGAISWPLQQQGRLNIVTYSASFVYNSTPAGISRVTLQPVRANALPISSVGGLTFVGGALPRVYDGSAYLENGFTQYPARPDDGGAGAGNQLSAGTYQWVAVYAYTDAQGNYRRSGPSIPLGVSVSAGTSRKIDVSSLELTGMANVTLELYRTVANGTVLYRSTTAANVTTDYQVEIDDDTPDTTLVGNEILYTTGGVNANIAPPPHTLAAVHKNRLIIAGIDSSPYAWRGSSTWLDGEGLRFNEAWGGAVPASTGPIVALTSMDGNLILFTAQAAYLVPGDGPDLLGNNNWPDAQLITALDGGPVSASVVSASSGVFYQDARGWHLLTRGLQVEYIGADVEAYGEYVCRAATVRPDAEEVWFQCDTGSDVVGQMQGTMVPSPGGLCLVYNTTYRQWSVLPRYGAQDACYYGGRYTRVRSDGTVFQEVPGTYKDGAAFYSSVVETAWLKPGQAIQGYQRVWRAALLGTFDGKTSLRWEVAYDYSPTYDSQDTITQGSDGLTVGGAFQVRRHLRVQKCEALRFRFTETPSGDSGAGMGLSSVDLEFGVYGQLWKLAASKSR
jgi:hypothetical protein